MAENATSPQGRAGVLRRHPVLVGIFAVCTVSGATLGALYLPAEWSIARRLFGGVFAGIGTAVFLTVTRLFD